MNPELKSGSPNRKEALLSTKISLNIKSGLYKK